MSLTHPANTALSLSAAADVNEPAELTALGPMRGALVNMPWALADRPSLQCGLLKAGLVQHGHEVHVHYLNLDLAALLGANPYAAIATLPSERTVMLGEWLFTVAAFGQGTDAAAYHAAFPVLDGLCDTIGITFTELYTLRDKILPVWLRQTLAAVSWEDYDVIGVTSLLQQHVAVLAAAKEVKSLAPNPSVVVGGANVDGDMGLEHLRRFTAIDYVVVGEGDRSFPELVAALSRGRPDAAIPGVFRRDAAGAVQGTAPRQVRDLDRLPIPD